MRKLFASLFVTAALSLLSVEGVKLHKSPLPSSRAQLQGPYSASGDYDYQGCFADASTKVISEYTGWVNTPEECRKRAEAKGYAIFGLRGGAQCFIG